MLHTRDAKAPVRKPLGGSASSLHALQAVRKARSMTERAWRWVDDSGQTPN